MTIRRLFNPSILTLQNFRKMTPDEMLFPIGHFSKARREARQLADASYQPHFMNLHRRICNASL